MNYLALALLTLVLTACGGGGGGGSATTYVASSVSIQTVLHQSQTNRVYNTAVGDLNNDGLEDIVVSGWNFDNPTAYIWLFTQNSDGTLTDNTNALPSNIIHGSQHVFIRDFDGDGRNDIFLPGFLDGTIMTKTPSIMLWNGVGGFTQQTFTEPVAAHGACIDDVNNDGRLDLIVGDGGIYYNQGNRNFTLDTTILQNNWFTTCAVTHQSNGDVNIILGNNYAVAGYRNNINIYTSAMVFQSAVGVVSDANTDLVEAMSIGRDFVLAYNDSGNNLATPYKVIYANTGDNNYTVGSVINRTNNEYHAYTTNINGVNAVFFPNYQAGSQVYTITGGVATEYQPGSFARMSSGYSWATASAVYRNTSTNKVYMLQLLDQTFYAKEMQ
jgi:hypothetical protein